MSISASKALAESGLQGLQQKYNGPIGRDDSLNLAIEAAEIHLKALRLTSDVSQKKRLKNVTLSLFEEAEKIKKGNDFSPNDRVYEMVFGPRIVGKPIPADPPKCGAVEEANAIQSSPNVKALQAPVSTRPLSIREQKVLLEGSLVNGAKFPPWKDSDALESFELAAGEEQFEDGYMFQMSEEQSRMIDGWKRPFAALPPPFWPASASDEGDHKTESLMKARPALDLVQDAATDCSVVASMTAAYARRERGFEKVLANSIHPFDDDPLRRSYSTSGRYHIRFNFNGCFRKVVIDDRLPVSKTARILHVVDRNNPTLLWPALLEKAYMKVCGGYDFPGSNSGTDLWTMTGWIPEQILLQHYDTEPEKLWQRIYKAFEFGDVFITLGTGKLSSQAERALGLVGEHDYAVLKLEETSGQRRFLIKNPWLRGVERQSGHSHPRGTFWLEMNQVVQNFENIYLNWNPGLFRFRQDIHFSWDMQDSQSSRSPAGSFIRNPQYTFSCAKSGQAWILLSKHIKSRNKTAPKHNQPEFISLYLFEGVSRRVMLSRGALINAPYVDSPQVLMKVDVRAGTAYTAVISEQELAEAKHNFTVSVFAASAMTLAEANPRYTHRTTTNGAWTRESAGGRPDLPTYSQNPQFKLDITRSTKVCLILETSVAKLRVHTIMLHSQSQRIFTVSSRDVVVESGPYRSRCAIAETKEALPTGSYIIICSTYDSNELGNFTLAVESDELVQMKVVPREGGGRLRTRLQDAMFSEDVSTLAAPLSVHRICRLSFSGAYAAGSHTAGGTHSSLSITVELGRGPDKRILASSSAHAAAVRTHEVDLRPEMTRLAGLWLVLERNGGHDGVGGRQQVVSLDMWSDVVGGVVVGEWMER